MQQGSASGQVHQIAEAVTLLGILTRCRECILISVTFAASPASAERTEFLTTLQLSERLFVAEADILRGGFFFFLSGFASSRYSLALLSEEGEGANGAFSKYPREESPWKPDLSRRGQATVILGNNA